MTLRCCAFDVANDQILIAEREGAVVGVHFGSDREAFAAELVTAREQVAWTVGRDSPARAQLREYFAGKRQRFDLRLRPHGTLFQHRVWTALQRIPFGVTRTYSDIAAQIGQPAAVRAVGAANGRNPIAIIVPCHRVIGRDGALTGYAGGLERKRRLLEHEGIGLPLSGALSGARSALSSSR